MTILYFNTGNPFYLKYSIAQTVEKNPTARVVLLGDEKNRDLGLCEWVPLADYFEGAAKFASIYQHLSANDRAFDLGCFQTWFVFAEFARKTELVGPVVCLDHDVLLYVNLQNWLDKYSFELATTQVVGNQYTIFRSAERLIEFADFITRTYSSAEGLARLEHIARDKCSPGPKPDLWICDMTLLGLFVETFGEQAFDLGEVHDSILFDYAFHIDEGFTWNPYKRIKRVSIDKTTGMPFGFRGGERLSFGGLHFQVGTKVFLPHYYTGKRQFTDRWRHEWIRYRGYFTDGLKWLLDGFGASERRKL